ncbi:PulJ/GspJ family protein [Pseudoxanthomonas mexicana]
MTPRRTQAGFSLLEAIVALTIFSICAMALYAWMSVNQTALVRVQARDAAVRDGRAALAALELVNPMADPAGNRALPGGLEVRWDSHEIVPRAPGTGVAGGMLVFDMALYEMEVSAVRKGRVVAAFTVRRAGWETVRTMRDDDF